MAEKTTQTKTEIEAWGLLIRAGGYGFEAATWGKNAHDAGNEIIRLAEQIKAERAVAAMKGIELKCSPIGMRLNADGTFEAWGWSHAIRVEGENEDDPSGT